MSTANGTKKPLKLPALKGTLFKRETGMFGRSSWDKLYFNLEGDKLCYYREKHSLEHDGFIDLGKEDLVVHPTTERFKCVSADEDELFAMQICYTESNKHVSLYLGALSREGMWEWISGMLKWIKHFQAAKRKIREPNFYTLNNDNEDYAMSLLKNTNNFKHPKYEESSEEDGISSFKMKRVASDGNFTGSSNESRSISPTNSSLFDQFDKAKSFANIKRKSTASTYQQPKGNFMAFSSQPAVERLQHIKGLKSQLSNLEKKVEEEVVEEEINSNNSSKAQSTSSSPTEIEQSLCQGKAINIDDSTIEKDAIALQDSEIVVSLMGESLHAKEALARRDTKIAQLQDTVAKKDEKILDLQQQLEEVRERYFFSIAMAMKLESQLMGSDHCNLQVQDLYDQLIRENIPIKQWPGWLALQTPIETSKST